MFAGYNIKRAKTITGGVTLVAFARKEGEKEI